MAICRTGLSALARLGRRLLLATVFLLLLLSACATAPLDEATTAYDHTTVREIMLLAVAGTPEAQFGLGVMYHAGLGVAQDYAEAARWHRRAADQGIAEAQLGLGMMYHSGEGVAQNWAEAARWYRRAADQGLAGARALLGMMYAQGESVPQDDLQAYIWLNLAAAGHTDGEVREMVAEARDAVAARLSPAQRIRAQEMAKNWRPTAGETPESVMAPDLSTQRRVESSGTGFVVSEDGQLVTNHHVVERCGEVRVRPAGKEAVAAVVVARDPGNDLVLLKAPVHLPAPAFLDDHGLRPGDSVVAVGFPLHGLLAAEASVTTGTVSALAGIGNDSRYFQVTVPVQPGNSGGPLLDLGGRVVGVVVGKLDALRVASLTGDIPQNVNFAIKAGVVRSFLNASGGSEPAPDPRAGAVHSIPRSPAAVGAEAKAFTVLVECWN